MGRNSRRTGSAGAVALTALLLLLIPGALFAGAGDSAPAAGPQRSVERAKPAVPSAEAESQTYDRCMKLARDDPHAARALAAGWRQRGGGHPADHCEAVALIGLGRYQEGATRLHSLAGAIVVPVELRAEVLDQEGQAWLLAGDPKRAFAAAAAAAKLAPDDLDVVVDRAEAAAASGYLDAAVADLDRVLKADPNRVDALVYRASANRALDRLDRARSDIDKALSLKPDSPAALLERGNIRGLDGDLDGARQDWDEVGRVAPGSAEDRAARANLARLARLDAPMPAAAKRGGAKQ
jgi:tetratricopeptide (TPR) repeat protein